MAVAEVAVVDFGVAAGPAASCQDDSRFSLAVAGFAASGAAAAAVVADGVVEAAVAAVDYNATAAAGEGHTACHPVPVAANHSSLVPI